jgi:hypothetical protein
MKQLPESLGALGVEGRVDGMRPGGAPAQRRLKTTLSLKRWMALRALWGLQPRLRAIW